MLSRNLICYLVDKKAPALFHSLNQLRSSRTSNYVIKQPYPLMGFEKSFTNLLNDIIAKEALIAPTCDIKKYLKDNAGHYRSTFTTLMELFQIDQKTARSMILKNQMLGDIPKKKLILNYNKLKSAGISNQSIQDNVLLLMEDSNVLEKKLETTKKIVDNIDDGVSFLYCDINSLDLYIERSTKRFASTHNEIEFFQEQLEVDTRQACQLISKYLNFVIYHPNYTLRKIKLLLEHKVSIHSLIKNNWPVYFTYAKLKSRLESCSKVGLLTPVELSILNCDTKDFRRLIAPRLTKIVKKCEKAEIIQFLSDKSGYDKTVIEDRIPQSVFDHILSMEDFSEKISIFLQEGYEYHDIIWECTVLALPKSRIVNRLSILKKLDRRLPNLNIFLCSQAKFFARVGHVKTLANKSG